MIFIRGDFEDGGTDVGSAIVVVIPKKIAGDADLARGMSGRFVTQIRRANKSRERLKTDAGTIEGGLCPRSYLANDRGRVARAWRVVGGFGKNFQVPVVKIGAAAIGGLGRAGIGEDEIAGE